MWYNDAGTDCQGGPGRMYCLIVEDEKETREGLCHLTPWSQIGVERVLAVPDGEQALREIHRERPDLVLSDVRMPHMNGVELIRRLREEGCFVPFIFLSGFSDKEYLKAAIRYQASDYVEKPINMQELMEALVRAARRLGGAPQTLPRMDELLTPGVDGVALLARLTGCGHALARAARLRVALLIPPALGCALPSEQVAYLLGEWGWPFLHEMNEEGGAALIAGESGGRDPDFAALLTSINRVGGGYSLAVSGPCALGALSGGYARSRALAERVFSGGEGRLYAEAPEAALARDRQFLLDTRQEILDCVEGHAPMNALGHLSALEHAWATSGCLSASEALTLLAQVRCALLDALGAGAAPAERDEELTLRWDEVARADALREMMRSFGDWLTLLIRRYFIMGRYTPAVATALLYICEHFAENITIEQLARACYVSPSYMSYLFKRNLDVTFKKYLMNLRMDQAKSLLRDPQRRLSDVSALVGIADASYFSKLFRKEAGMSPSAYRERILP